MLQLHSITQPSLFYSTLQTIALKEVPFKSELYCSLWQSGDTPPSGMNASQYKDYVLVLLFIKRVCDKTPANLINPSLFRGALGSPT